MTDNLIELERRLAKLEDDVALRMLSLEQSVNDRSLALCSFMEKLAGHLEQIRGLLQALDEKRDPPASSRPN